MSTSTFGARAAARRAARSRRRRSRRPSRRRDARRDEAQADEHRQGAGEVRAEVPRVGHERCVPLEPALRSEIASGRVDDKHDQSARTRTRRPDRRGALVQPHHGLDRDPDRGRREERRLAEGGEMLRLAVAVRVLAVGRPLGHADRVQGQAGGRRVDARVRRLGQDAEAAAREPTTSLTSARPIAARATPPRCAARVTSAESMDRRFLFAFRSAMIHLPWRSRKPAGGRRSPLPGSLPGGG